jgi:hypothetical protein
LVRKHGRTAVAPDAQGDVEQRQGPQHQQHQSREQIEHPLEQAGGLWYPTKPNMLRFE